MLLNSTQSPSRCGWEMTSERRNKRLQAPHHPTCTGFVHRSDPVTFATLGHFSSCGV
jgi:hypothetical protein